MGEDLRQLPFGHRHDGMADDTELLLMFAARAEHPHRIRTGAGGGSWVLCDRFTDATYAYQGIAGRLVSICSASQHSGDRPAGERRPDLTSG